VSWHTKQAGVKLQVRYSLNNLTPREIWRRGYRWYEMGKPMEAFSAPPKSRTNSCRSPSLGRSIVLGVTDRVGSLSVLAPCQRGRTPKVKTQSRTKVYSTQEVRPEKRGGPRRSLDFFWSEENRMGESSASQEHLCSVPSEHAGCEEKVFERRDRDK